MLIGDSMSGISPSQIVDYAATYGIVVPGDKAELMIKHFNLLLEANHTVNLTRITDPQEALSKHIVDSLLFVTGLNVGTMPSRFRYIDIGTGAGYPGIPFGIISEMQGVLLDSVAKKTRAVSYFVDQLGFSRDLTVECSRVEDFANHNINSFDVAIARAVADLGTLLEYAAPLLKHNGILIASKAKVDSCEIDISSHIADICGFSLIRCNTFELPYHCGTRTIYVYKLVEQPSVKLPRRVGLAKHKPLWKSDG